MTSSNTTGHHYSPVVFDDVMFERRLEGERQGHVAEVVVGELQLPALGRAGLGSRHDAGVVDQRVERALPGVGEGGQRLAALQVEDGVPHRLAAGAATDVGRRLLALLRSTDGEGDLGAGPGEGAGRLEAEARGAAGDDDAAAGEVEAVDHLGGGGGGGERGGESCHGVNGSPAGCGTCTCQPRSARSATDQESRGACAV
jgi:hypothetical protein